MKQKKLTSSLIKCSLLIFCTLPYVFWSMNADASTGSIFFYYLMCMVVLLFLVVAIKTKNVIILLSGNVLSLILSFCLVLLYQTDEWGYYFKPFTSLGFLIFITSISWGVQLIVLNIVRTKGAEKTLG